MKPGDALTPDEKELFERIQSNDTDQAIALIDNNSSSIRIDCLDESGTTLLQQAAFKGNVRLCRLLIANGADVNSTDHVHGYTTLMFAALSGSCELCALLLDAGAKSYCTNTINRTASEMAAFIGQHECVSIINNYLSVDEIERLICPKSINANNERMPLHFAAFIHQLARSYNVHPVHILRLLQKNIEILDHRKQFLLILDELFEKQLRVKESNEVMAVKLWMISYVIKEALKFVDDQRKTTADSDTTSKSTIKLLDTYAKYLLTTTSTTIEDNFTGNLETLIRHGIRAFPYHNFVLFQTLVKAVAQSPYGEGGTSALTYLHQTLLGQRMMLDGIFCSVCGEPQAKKRCSSCKKTHYCSVECQQLHWFDHRRWCRQQKIAD